MTTRQLVSAAAAVSLAGAAVLGMAATTPAIAQVAPAYPVESGTEGPGVTDSTPVPGQRITVATGPGAFPAGTRVSVTVVRAGQRASGGSINGGTSSGGRISGGTISGGTAGDVVLSGTETANADGSVDFTLNAPSEPGRYDVVFAGAGRTVTVPFTVVAAAAAGPGNGQGADGNGAGGNGGGGNGARANRALPFTGTDAIVPLTITGVTLVGVGGGIVVASRRRREDMPRGVA